MFDFGGFTTVLGMFFAGSLIRRNQCPPAELFGEFSLQAALFL